jgi:hypothetical protein
MSVLGVRWELVDFRCGLCLCEGETDAVMFGWNGWKGGLWGLV